MYHQMIGYHPKDLQTSIAAMRPGLPQQRIEETADARLVVQAVADLQLLEDPLRFHQTWQVGKSTRNGGFK